MKSYSVFIEHQCPQCGAPAALAETERLFSCVFCRVRSYLGAGDFFRYRLPAQVPAGTALFYIPYWRFKGMIFSAGNDGVLHHYLDISASAVRTALFPPSLGFRSQALKLKFVSPEDQGRFVEPERSLDEVMEGAIQRLKLSLPKPVRHLSRVGENISLIYSPFYIEKGVFDGVLNTRISSNLPPNFDPSSLEGGQPRWRIHFYPCLCPDCGWDMTGDRDTLVLHCHNCETAWEGGVDGFRKIQAAHLPTGEKNSVYLPFWRIQAGVEGVRLAVYEDLVRVSNLPVILPKGRDERPFYFWVPAFKIRPGQFLRLAKQATLTAPTDAFEPRIPKGAVHAVTLSGNEAASGLMSTLIDFAKPQNELLERIEEVHVHPKGFKLVYFPFKEGTHEWIQPDYRIVINKNTLTLAKTL